MRGKKIFDLLSDINRADWFWLLKTTQRLV